MMFFRFCTQCSLFIPCALPKPLTLVSEFQKSISLAQISFLSSRLVSRIAFRCSFLSHWHINCEVVSDSYLFYQNSVFPISGTGTINYPVSQVRSLSRLRFLSPLCFTVIPSHCRFYFLNLSHVSPYLSVIVAVVSDPYSFKPMALL